MNELRCPYPWVGGKSRVAHIVWRGFGNPPNYIEPFYGSGAVLLGRPDGPGKIETINDIDGGVINCWRAIKWSPRQVAEWCDWPVSELDLHARHAWLVKRLETMRDELRADPDFYDAQVAGWWLWGICQWIGTGWCGGIKRGHPRPNLNDGQGVHAPGVNLPAIGNDRGINGVSAPPCTEWFLALQQRMRRVRIVCGDWQRVLGPSVLGKGKNVGGRRPTAIFFDPPYEPELRTKRLYNDDAEGLSAEVRKWCIEHGNDPELRIALCGYEGEHDMPSDWNVYAWKGARGYAGEGNDNREKERIWFSPHCLPVDPQPSLFDRYLGNICPLG